MAKPRSKERYLVRSFTIDLNLFSAVENYAKEHETTISWVIRQALKSFVPLKYYGDNNRKK